MRQVNVMKHSRKNPETGKYIHAEKWENRLGWGVDKMCLSCKFCVADERGVGMTSPVRTCISHKTKNGDYSKVKIVDRNNFACCDWMPKTGLLEIGKADGHAVRKIDIDSKMRKYVADDEKKQKELAEKRRIAKEARELYKKISDETGRCMQEAAG